MIAEKVYILYLEEHKKKRMESRLKDFPIPYEFIKGPDGRKDDFLEWLDNEGYGIMKDYVVTDKNHDKMDRKGVGLANWYRQGITTGEVGCGLGHWYMWKKAKEDNVERALFLEDDALICQTMILKPDPPRNPKITYEEDKLQLLKILQHLEYAEDIDWDLMYLGYDGVWPHENIEDRGGMLKEPLMEAINPKIAKVNFVYCLHAYIVTAKGIDILLDNNFEKNLCVADEYIPALYQDGKYSYAHPKLTHLNRQMKACGTIPMLVDQEDKSLSNSLTTQTEVIDEGKL